MVLTPFPFMEEEFCDLPPEDEVVEVPVVWEREMISWISENRDAVIWLPTTRCGIAAWKKK